MNKCLEGLLGFELFHQNLLKMKLKYIRHARRVGWGWAYLILWQMFTEI